MKSFILLGLAMLATSAAERITVLAGDDFEATCLHVVQPGDTCYLEEGDYYHDGLTVTHGTETERITITGDSNACIKGSNTQDRVLQIAHDYYTVEGLCFDGKHDEDYVATAIYVLGADHAYNEKHGVTSSVTGFQMFDNTITNFGSECVHFRYFVTHAEVSGNSFEGCGKNQDFAEDSGEKVGEGIYLGTAPDQLKENKTPEPKFQEDESDDEYFHHPDADVCAYNWIHHNTFKTYGNECVDVKEGSVENLIEHNTCGEQEDVKSGCFGSRGSDNTFRFNNITDCAGAGIRVGGDNDKDKEYGQGNNMYGNTISNCGEGAFSVNSPNQGIVCDNDLDGVDIISGGDYGDDHRPTFEAQFSNESATGSCSSQPGDRDYEFFPLGTTENGKTAESGNDEARSATPQSEGDQVTAGSDDDNNDDNNGDNNDDKTLSPDPTPQPEDDGGSEDQVSSGSDDDSDDNSTPSPTPQPDDAEDEKTAEFGNDQVHSVVPQSEGDQVTAEDDNDDGDNDDQVDDGGDDGSGADDNDVSEYGDAAADDNDGDDDTTDGGTDDDDDDSASTSSEETAVSTDQSRDNEKYDNDQVSQPTTDDGVDDTTYISSDTTSGSGSSKTDDGEDAVEVGTETNVTVTATGYDDRASGKGCGEKGGGGCAPALSRDGISTDVESRWSCAPSTVDGGGTCQIEYRFSAPQDIVEIQVAFWQGDTRTRTLEVYLNDEYTETFDSYYPDDETVFNTFKVSANGITTVTLESVGSVESNGDELWISLIEVRIFVTRNK